MLPGADSQHHWHNYFQIQPVMKKLFMKFHQNAIWIAILPAFFLVACNQPVKQSNPLPAADTVGTALQPEGSKQVSADSAPQAHAGESLPSSGAGLAAFIPPDYSILDTAGGDLNGDAYPDKLLLLKKRGEDTSSDVTEHPEKRPLLILAGQQDATYKLAASSDNAVLCVDCGGVMGDPYMRLVIKGGYFSVELAGGSSWRWTRTVTFKYASGEHNWFLYKDGHSSFHASEPGKVETKLYTAKDFGKVSFEQFDVYKEQ